MFLLLLLYINNLFFEKIVQTIEMLSTPEMISLMCFLIVSLMFIIDVFDKIESKGNTPKELELFSNVNNELISDTPLKNEFTMTKMYMNAKPKKELKDKE